MSPFITNHIIPHCFVSAGCSILVVFYAANLCAQLWSPPLPCSVPAWPWPTNSALAQAPKELATNRGISHCSQKKNHTTKFMEKRPTLCFSSVSLFFPFPGAQKKRSRSLVIKLVKLWLLKLWLQVSKIRLFSPFWDFQNDSDWVMSYGSGSKINVSSSLATVVSQTRF